MAIFGGVVFLCFILVTVNGVCCWHALVSRLSCEASSCVAVTA